jgi:hypothetical protein
VIKKKSFACNFPTSSPAHNERKSSGIVNYKRKTHFQLGALQFQEERLGLRQKTVSESVEKLSGSRANRCDTGKAEKVSRSLN